jgi:large conductance mechanosensitive channel
MHEHGSKRRLAAVDVLASAYRYPTFWEVVLKKVLDEFKTFAMQGNVVDLAVAVVLGAAFGKVVASLVNDILLSIVAMIVGEPTFNGLSFTINGATFGYGNFITEVIAFLAVAAAIFFFVVKPMKMIKAKMKPAEEAGPTHEAQVLALLEKIAAK